MQGGVQVSLVFQRIAVNRVSRFQGQGQGGARGFDLGVSLQPRHAQNFRTRPNEVAGLQHELLDRERLEIDVASQPLQVLLVFDETQAQLLLHDFGVSLDRFLLPLQFLIAQIPEGRNDHDQEKQHRHQRPQGRIAVLLTGALLAPPAPEQAVGRVGLCWAGG